MTRFSVGQLVRSQVSAQGLVKGETYRVVEIDARSTFAGEIVTYFLCATNVASAPVLQIGNGHLLLTEAK